MTWPVPIRVEASARTAIRTARLRLPRERAAQLGGDALLLGVGQLVEHRQAQRAGVIRFGPREVAAPEAQRREVGLQVDRDVLHVDEDPARAQPLEGGAPSRRIDRDRVQVPGRRPIAGQHRERAVDAGEQVR